MATKKQSRGSELGSVGLAETQVFFVWPYHHSIDSLYSTNSVNVFVPSDNQQFWYKIARGWQVF